MSKKSGFRGCVDKEYGKRVEPLLKSALKHIDHTHWSVAGEIELKKVSLIYMPNLGTAS